MRGGVLWLLWNAALVIAFLYAVGLMIHAAWFTATHRCAEYDRVWRERSCSPNFRIDGYGNLDYLGEECVEAHWARECVRWVQ